MIRHTLYGEKMMTNKKVHLITRTCLPQLHLVT